MTVVDRRWQNCEHLCSEFSHLLEPSADGKIRERRKCWDCGEMFNVRTSLPVPADLRRSTT